MVGRARRPGRSEHHLSLGATLFRCLARRPESHRGPETYARIRGRWHYIYRAIDGHGQIVDAYVSSTRDLAAGHRFFERAITCSGTTPLMRNTRRDFYRIVQSVPQRLVFAWTWIRLAETV